MISLTCRSCGGSLAAADDAFCVHCGTPVVDETDASDRPSVRDDRPLLSKGVVTMGAALVAVIAIGAIAATFFASLIRDPEPGPIISGGVAVTTTTIGQIVQAEATIWPFTQVSDPPVASALTIEDPAIDQLARYVIEGEPVTFRIDGTHCGRGTGTIQAAGVVHNYSLAQQTLDYVLRIELVRAWNRARIGELETTIEGVGPFESAEWSVEMLSSRVSTIECRITAVTVLPGG